MSILTIFDSAESRQYFVDDDDIVWLHGTLLCKRLGFANTNEAILMHTEEDERRKVDTGKLGKKPWFVNEYGVWGMILAARTPEAIAFKQKLKNEILPTIRRDGAYISPDITIPQAQAVKEKVCRILDDALPWERLYDENRSKGFKWFGYRFYNDYIYSFFTPEEWCKINNLNPVRKEANGRCDRLQRIHQYIEPATKERLKGTVATVLGFVDVSNTPEEFQELYRRKYGRIEQLKLDL